MSAMAQHRPVDLTIHRASGMLTVTWIDGHVSTYGLAWLRANCPCASCREERLAREDDPLQLHQGPLPSVEIAGAELVGNYAVRLIWTDGHSSGIYGFASLRAACPCAECSPDGAVPLLPD
jgi:DUF971 family protein